MCPSLPPEANTGDHRKAQAKWTAWLLHRPNYVQAGLSLLNHGPHHELVSLLSPEGYLRTQQYTNVFGSEVNEGDLLIIRHVQSARKGGENMQQLSAATNCLTATLGGCLKPGFMILLQDAWEDVPQLPGDEHLTYSAI